MAKLPKLIEALAAVDERPRATLEYIARIIREGGELPTTKRGSGASDMTLREAANLLIGVSVAEAAPKDAAALVGQYRTLSVQAYSQPVEESLIKTLANHISASQNFGEALERLIEASPVVLAIFKVFVDAAFCAPCTDEKRTYAHKGLLYGHHARVEVKFVRPIPYANVSVLQTLEGRDELICEWRFRMDERLIKRGFYNYAEGDAISSRTIGLRTLLKLFIATASVESLDAAEAEYGLALSELTLAA